MDMKITKYYTYTSCMLHFPLTARRDVTRILIKSDDSTFYMATIYHGFVSIIANNYDCISSTRSESSKPVCVLEMYVKPV